MSKFDKDYAEGLRSKLSSYHSFYCYEGTGMDVIVRKSDVDDTYGVYESCDGDDYRISCTDETIDVYIAINESAFNDEYREKMWSMLVEEAMTHGFKKTLPNLSKVSDDDLTAEMKRRGLIL